jgi:hypothetical protein
MDTDRNLACAQLAGRLFIQQSGDDMRKHLPLSGCEPCITLLDLIKLRVLGPRRAIDFNGGVDRADEIFLFKWLR